LEAFLSHSRKDKGIVNNIYKVCKRAKIEPNIAEFEDIEKGKIGAEQIREMNDKSELFFLFLSENVVNAEDASKTIYTQNWVNFELGCAYAQKKEKKKSIYVFESFNQIHFPIPYLDYYILYDPVHNPHWEYIQNLLTEESSYGSIHWTLMPLAWIVSGVYRLKGQPIQRPSDTRGFPIHHDCGAKYTFLSRPKHWSCQRCRKLTDWTPT